MKNRLLILLALTMVAASAWATTWTVGPTGNYTTIQAAISAATTLDGDIIQIDAGTYTQALSVNKSLTFIGSGPASLPTTIITHPTSNVISLTVTGKSYTFQNLIVEGNVTNNGIRAGGSININSLTLKDFIGRNCQVALYLAEYWPGVDPLTTTVNNLYMENVTLTNNKFIGAYIGKTVLSGLVTNCTISDNGYSDELPSSWQKTGLQFVNFDEASVPHVVVTNSYFSNNGVGASNIERTGLILYSAYNAFSPVDLLTVTGCSFSNHPKYAVRIRNGYNIGNTATVNGTFSNNWLDIWFNNIIGSTSSTTLVRNTFDGIRTVGAGPAFDYNTIQAAINAANPGDEIIIAAGTYTEQVLINKENLTLTGAGIGQTIIKSPATLALSFGTKKAVVCAHTVNNVTINNLTIDGDGKGNSNYQFVGLAFWNAGGTVNDVDVIGVRDTPFSGAQHGVGVYAYNDTGGPYTLTIDGMNVSDFQKNAFALSGTGLWVDLDNISVTGAGSTTVTAQNGIQISYGASGTVDNASITGIDYIDIYPPIPDWTATAVLLYEGGTVDLNYVNITNSQTNVYFIDTDGSFTNGSLTTPVSNYWADGIDVYASGSKGTKGGLKITPAVFEENGGKSGSKGTVTIEVANSTFTGILNVDCIGICAIADGTIDLTISDNNINNWDYGIYAYEYTGGVVNVTAHGNDLSGNNIAFYYGTESKGTIDATNNYWGTIVGSEIAALVSGNIDYTPWCNDDFSICTYGSGGGPAPVTTIADVIVECTNETISVPVTVTGFNNVGAISLTINYDDDNFLIDNVDDIEFNDAIGSATWDVLYGGVITISWFGNTGVNLPDGAILFTMNFTWDGATCPTGVDFDIIWNNTVAGYCEYAPPGLDEDPYVADPFGDYFIAGNIAIERTTPPDEIGVPVANGTTVECFANAIEPTNLPVVKDVCGVTLSPSTPNHVGSTYAGCEGTYTWVYTYTDCTSLQFIWTYTYTIERVTEPAEVGTPVDIASNIECASDAVAPTLPVVEDVCGNVLTPTGPDMSGTYVDCEGTIIYTYTYTDCADLEFIWSYTYTVDRVTLPTNPPDDGSTVYDIANAVPPTLPVVTDVCGAELTGVLASVVDYPVPFVYQDDATRTYTYTFTDCSGLQSDWVYVYTIPGVSVSGIVTYYKTGYPVLNKVDVTYNGPVVKTYTTDDLTGAYSISNLAPGTYDITFYTAKAVGGINSTDAAQVNYWGVNNSTIEKVRWLAGDVAGTDYKVNANDALLIQQYFLTQGTPGTPFNSTWSFWKPGETISSNPGVTLGNPEVTISGTVPTATQDFYGLASGDFNRSFTPGNDGKSGSESLTLTYGQTIEVGMDAFELPLYAGMDMSVGAVSLIMNIPSDVLQVNSVYLGSDPNSQVLFNVTGDELRISWYSSASLQLQAGQRLLTLALQVVEPTGDPIYLNLVSDPLNELADQDFEVFNAQLMVDIIKTTILGTGENLLQNNLMFSNHPNPFVGTTNFVYSIPSDGKVLLEVFDILGNKVMVAVDEMQSAGEYLLKVDRNTLQQGIYMAVLKLENGSGTMSRTIKIISK